MLGAMAWADERTLEALRQATTGRDEALGLMSHVVAGEHIWLMRLLGRPARFAVFPELSLEECEALARENAEGLAGLLAPLTEEQLKAPAAYRSLKGEAFETPLIDIITHVVIHGAYHRGQVARALGRAGSPAPVTDYIAYVRTLDA
jgi:uncharacterized damage-inducible protein DinB